MARSTFRRAILVLSSLLLLLAVPATSGAAEPVGYELAAATHTGSVAVAADGTAWFVPSRGTKWRGTDHSALGSVAADGTVSERHVAGFTGLSEVATGLEGDLWVSGLLRHGDRKVFEIGRLSPTGDLVRRYAVGRAHGTLSSMAVSAAAVWFIRERRRQGDSVESIESLDIASGKLRNFRLPHECEAYALAVASDGTPWFTQKCGGFRDDGSKSKTSVSHFGPEGQIVRRMIAAKDYPVSLSIGPEGTVWFAAWAYYEPNRIGRLTSSGELKEFPMRKASPYTIAAGPEGRLWFPSLHGSYFSRLDSVGVDGDLGTPICADSTCGLEAAGLTRAPDGSLWYGLIRPNYNTGGGSSGMYIEEEIHNEAGFIGHLAL